MPRKRDFRLRETRRSFEEINARIEGHGLLDKKGTIVGAVIVASLNRPLSQRKRQQQEEKPTPQIDSEAGLQRGTRLIK